MKRVFLLAAASLGALAPAAAQAPVVDSIAIITEDIFADNEAGNILFSLANALHIKTRTIVVRRELLFQTGAPYDSTAVAETARNLRRLGIFRLVSIDSVRVDGRLVVRVQTADGWSTSLDIGAGSTGDQFTWNVGLFENNLLGTATRGGGSYRQETDRTAWRVAGTVRRLGTSRIAIDGFYDDLSDGYRWFGWTGVPFRALQDPGALIVETDGSDRRIPTYREGLRAETFQERAAGLRLTAGMPVQRHGSGYVRVGLAAMVRRHALGFHADTLLPPPVTEDSVIGAVGPWIEWLSTRYQVVRHFNGFGRPEDLDLSTGVTLGLWVAPAQFGYVRGGLGPALRARTALPLGPHFVRFAAEAHGLWTSDGLDSATVIGRFTLGVRPAERHSTVLHVQAGAEQRPVPSLEFDLGSRRGPRAFQAHSFTGDRMFWGTLEHRWFIADNLGRLLGVGLAAFADFGGAWFDGDTPRTGGDVGLGLRLGPSRASGLNVGRFDLAWRWGDGVGSNHWVFSFGRAFVF
ncbi:MAG: hypothetical protein WD934_11590 [Gemmatimonadales bacterium]